AELAGRTDADDRTSRLMRAVFRLTTLRLVGIRPVSGWIVLSSAVREPAYSAVRNLVSISRRMRTASWFSSRVTSVVLPIWPTGTGLTGLPPWAGRTGRAPPARLRAAGTSLP